MHVPEGWRKVSLSNVAEIRTGVAKGKQNIKDPIELPYLRVANVQDGYIDLSDVKNIQIERNQIERFSLKIGDVLMTEGGDFDKLGRGDVWNGQINPCLHQNHVFAVRPDQQKLNSYFLAALSASHYGKTYFLSCSKQSTNLASINSTQLKDFPVLLPTLPEQQKIAQILSTWDKAIEKLEALIAAKQKRKKALMQQLLTGKKRFAEFEGKWEKIKLSQVLCEIKKETIPEANKYELLTVKLHCKGAVRSGKYPTPTEGGRPYFLREQGELIIGRQNLHNGGIAIVPKEASGCVASNAISSFDIKRQNSKLFILYRMSLPKFFSTVDNLVGGTGQKEISVKELMKIKIRIPKLEIEQQKIASVLSAADAEIETHQKQLSALKEQKKGLMQQLLTGKKRVKVDDHV